jgi:transposase
MPNLPELSILTHEQKNELIRALYHRLVESETRMLKNSCDSGKPPSSDGLSGKRISFS